MHENDRGERLAADLGQVSAGPPETRTESWPNAAGLQGGVTIDFDEIAHGSKLVLIRYRGQVYQLRTTRNGKLILNK